MDYQAEYLRIKEKFEKTHEELQESLTQYKNLIETTTDLIIKLNSKGRILYINEACLGIFGLNSEECIDLSIFDMMYRDDKENAQKEFLQLADSDKTQAFCENRLMHKSGTYHTMMWNIHVNRDNNNKVINFTSILRNITEIKKTELNLLIAKEKAKESDRLNTTFLTNMSHEIRTPLNGIIGFANMLINPEISDSKKNTYVDFIAKSSNQLLKIVNDIIDISKIETDQFTLNSAETDIRSVLSKTISLYSVLAKNENIKFLHNVEIPDNIEYIIIDEQRLVQVLNNLLDNSLKFTRKGKISLTCSTKTKQLEFSVSDTGIGIAPEFHEKIFERFQQANESATRKHSGTGLGLAICKELVGLLGGKIWVDSVPGKGSTFYFTVDYNPVKSDIALLEEAFADDVEDLSDITILIAEDEEVNSIYITELLANRNIHFVLAKDGKQAVNLCKSLKYITIILMDIKMPVMDGIEATKIIKKLRPELPIIALTAFAFREDKERVMAAGCDYFISKPVEEKKLLNIIEKYV